MEAVWFLILGAMLTAYAVLDGFDFGAGIVHLIVAKTDEERRTVLAAVGPVWDGNEVWLIASGGVLVFAFPRAYAAAFSGLYLALMIVLWLLVLRGLAIEFRSKLGNPLWRSAWDVTFAGASITMAVVLGVALGNLVRGVPLGARGYFQQDLFARPGAAHVGSIDVFTVVFGLFALAVLAAHGGTFLAWKTAGRVSERSRLVAGNAWLAAVVVGAAATVVTAVMQPRFFGHFIDRPWLWPLPVLSLAAAFVARALLGRRRDHGAFLASASCITLMLLATAGTLYPTILKSTVDDAFTITAHNAASPPRNLAIGVVIWLPAIALAIGYFVYLYRCFRGKAQVSGRFY